MPTGVPSVSSTICPASSHSPTPSAAFAQHAQPAKIRAEVCKCNSLIVRNPQLEEIIGGLPARTPTGTTPVMAVMRRICAGVLGSAREPDIGGFLRDRTGSMRHESRRGGRRDSTVKTPLPG